jgi:hypothetical protein
MRRKWIPVLCLTCIFIAVLACEGGTSGSVTNASQTCQSASDRGECEGKFGRLSGTYGKAIEDDSIFSMDVVDVEARVTVESGSVKVSLEGTDGQIASAEAHPGQPATLIGTAEGDSGGFTVTFESISDQASNVRYNISYQVR